MRDQDPLSLPREYLSYEDDELVERIMARRKEISSRMVLLAHHYQRNEIVDMADFVGDSYYLSRMASLQDDAEFIVFCGVHFMAESADILSSENQVVLHPDLTAGCPMADMADIFEVEEAWSVLGMSGDRDFIPVTYMNSDAELKAFCGKWGGGVCTSSNAASIFDRILEQRKRIFFFPDEHLGRNIAYDRGIADDEIVVWDPKKELGGNDPQCIREARIVIWKGYCHVHTWFSTQHVLEVRNKAPEAKIVVHPECVSEVASMADAFGSTQFMVDYVKEAPPGVTIYVGTEIHHVNRLARDNPEKEVLPLARSLCPNMYKVSLNDLLWTIDHLGDVNVVNVPKEVKRDAKRALERMLDVD